MRYLITHGQRDYGYNPGHTLEGIRQIASLVPTLPKDISRVVIGTGKRFIEIYGVLLSKGFNESIKITYSPFCGSADGLEADGMVIISGDRKIPDEKYVSLIRSSAFCAWEFIGSFLENTLFCAGGELLTALGFKEINKKGCLYELDYATLDATLIKEGKAE